MIDIFNEPLALTFLWFAPLLIWTMVWKGIALWKAGRNDQIGWFIAILIINSMGLLPIIYSAFFQKKEKSED